MTNEQRSRAWFKKHGAIVGTASWWNAHAGRRIDLFGVFDLVALDVPRKRIVGVQCCRAADIATRRSKIIASPNAAAWLLCFGGIVIHGWRQQNNRRWNVTRRRVSVVDFDPDTITAARVLARTGIP